MQNFGFTNYYDFHHQIGSKAELLVLVLNW